MRRKHKDIEIIGKTKLNSNESVNLKAIQDKH